MVGRVKAVTGGGRVNSEADSVIGWNQWQFGVEPVVGRDNDRTELWQGRSLGWAGPMAGQSPWRRWSQKPPLVLALSPDVGDKD